MPSYARGCLSLCSELIMCSGVLLCGMPCRSCVLLVCVSGSCTRLDILSRGSGHAHALASCRAVLFVRDNL